MKLRATIRLRNEHLLKARAKTGLNQKDAAEAAGVPWTTLCKLEKLDYTVKPEHAAKLALFYGLAKTKVMPKGWEGIRIPHTVEKVHEVEGDRMLGWGTGGVDRMLSDPEERYVVKEREELVESALLHLTARQRFIVKSVLFDEMTFKAIGEEVGVCGQQVHTIYAKALRRLRTMKGPSTLLLAAASDHQTIRRAEIDAMSYERMLRIDRFGSPEYHMEEGVLLYFREELSRKRCEVGEGEHARANNQVGWDE